MGAVMEVGGVSLRSLVLQVSLQWRNALCVVGYVLRELGRMGAPGDPPGLAGTGSVIWHWMTGSLEGAGDISHQTWGFLCCRSRSSSVPPPGAGATGLGAAEACLGAGSGASICAASSPAKKREMALLLRGGDSCGPGGLTGRQLPAASTAALSEHPSPSLRGARTKVTDEVGDASPLGYGCQLPVAMWVGTAPGALPVPWSGSSFLRAFWESGDAHRGWAEGVALPTVVVALITVTGRCWGTGHGHPAVGEPGASAGGQHAPRPALSLQPAVWEGEAKEPSLEGHRLSQGGRAPALARELGPASRLSPAR